MNHHPSVLPISTQPLPPTNQPFYATWLKEALARQQHLSWFALLVWAAMLPTLLAMGLDDRTLRGVNVWLTSSPARMPRIPTADGLVFAARIPNLSLRWVPASPELRAQRLRAAPV